jgi:toxin ParE1/3/4
MNIRYAPLAVGDIDRKLRYLRGKNPQGADRVSRALGATIAWLAQYPQSGHETDFPELREFVLTKYPYRILYRLRGSEIRIVSVRHASRRWPVDIDTK